MTTTKKMTATNLSDSQRKTLRAICEVATADFGVPTSDLPVYGGSGKSVGALIRRGLVERDFLPHIVRPTEAGEALNRNLGDAE